MKNLEYQENDDGVMVDAGGFSGDNWSPKEDVRAFSGLFSEIISSGSGGQGMYGPIVPSFAPEIIEKGQSADPKKVESFSDIFKLLKTNHFKILEDVDIREVSDFVRWIEWSERLTQ
jgi:hypothetical protein